MKVFISASLILLLLIGGVISNGLFLHDRLCGMIDAVLALPDATAEDAEQYEKAMAALNKLWEQMHPFAVITVSAGRIENIDRAIGNIKTGWETDDDTAYRQARADLLLLLRRLRAMESYSFSAII